LAIACILSLVGLAPWARADDGDLEVLHAALKQYATSLRAIELDWRHTFRRPDGDSVMERHYRIQGEADYVFFDTVRSEIPGGLRSNGMAGVRVHATPNEIHSLKLPDMATRFNASVVIWDRARWDIYRTMQPMAMMSTLMLTAHRLPLYKVIAPGLACEIDRVVQEGHAYIRVQFDYQWPITTGVAQRFKERMLFDPEHDYLLKEHATEIKPGEPYLIRFQVSEYGQFDDPTEGRKRWVPLRASAPVWKGKGEDVFEISNVKVNGQLSQTAFVCQIPDGARVIDHIRNREYIQGGRRALEAIMKKNATLIQASVPRSPSADNSVDGVTLDATPRSGTAWLLASLLGGASVLLLVVVGWLRLSDRG
jgi:hypothetical protein